MTFQLSFLVREDSPPRDIIPNTEQGYGDLKAGQPKSFWPPLTGEPCLGLSLPVSEVECMQQSPATPRVLLK